MSLQKINPRTAILLLIMVLVAAVRLLSHFTDHPGVLTNFTPIGAMALFGGAYFNGKVRPFAFPLFTLFISDVILSFTIYAQYRSGLLYSGWVWVYLAFALMVIAGKLLLKNPNIKNILLAVIVTSVIHWLVANAGDCGIESGITAFLPVYFERLMLAIPYQWSFLAGTFIYSIIMFGSFELLQRKTKWIQA
jgi:hypothetical protein